MDGQVMPGGIAGGMPPQAAPQMPPQGAIPPQAGGLGGAPQMPQDADLQTRLNKLITMFQSPGVDVDRLKLLGEIDSTSKLLRTQQNMQQQMAVMQGQRAMAQGPIANQVVSQATQQLDRGLGSQQYGYAGGGLVAFAGGGGTEIEQILAKGPYERTPEDNQKLRDAGYETTQRALGPAGNPISVLDRFLSQYIDAPKAPPAEPVDELARLRALQGPGQNDELARLKALSAPSAPPAAARPAPRPGAGAPAAARPAAAPAKDDYLARLAEQKKAIEDMYKQETFVSPELVEARKQEAAARDAASGTRKSILERQLADLAEQKAALKQMGETRGIDNTNLLLALASGAQGRTLGQALSGAAGAGLTQRNLEEKQRQDMQDKIRAQQLGIDQATLAKMDYDAATKQLAVAEATGDRKTIVEAQKNKFAAQGKLLDYEQKERHSELAAATQLKAAGIQAAAAASRQDLAERKLALQTMKQDPEYKGVADALATAMKSAAVIKSPVTQQQLRDAQAAAARLAAKYGVTPDMFGVGSETPGASPGAAGQPMVYDWNKISAPKS